MNPITAMLKNDDETIACAKPACGAILGSRHPKRMWKDLETGVRYREPMMVVTLRLGYRRIQAGAYSMPRRARDRTATGRLALHRRPISGPAQGENRRSPEIAALDPKTEPKAIVECHRCRSVNLVSVETMRLIDNQPDKWADEIMPTANA
jgi:hypothetical protein